MMFGMFSQGWWILGVGTIGLVFFLVLEWKKEKWRQTYYSSEQRNFLFGENFAWNRFIKNLFLVLSVVLFSFVLLDPRWGMIHRTERIEGVDIVLVVDMSQSMLCEDIGESRIERLRRIVFNFMSKGGNHRLGLVFFAAEAYPVVPLTFDYEVISLWLQESHPLFVENQGSNLEDGLRKAMDLFEKNTLSHRVIVVLSDGEDMEHNPLKVASQIARKGVQVVTIGIGTPLGGKIPLMDERGGRRVFLTVEGKEVVTRLRADILRDIAKKTGGIFIEGTEDAGDALASYVEKIKKNPYGKASYETMNAQYQYFLLPAILCWLLSLFWPMGRNIGFVFVMGIFFMVIPPRIFANDGVRGTKFYREGRYAEAKEAFQRALIKKSSSLKLRYNLGNTFYHLGELGNAAKEFSRLTNEKSRDMKFRSLFNLGTTLATGGEKEEAARVYLGLLQIIPKKHPLYLKTIENLLYLQQPKPNQLTSLSQTSSQTKISSQEKEDTQKQKADTQLFPSPEDDVEAILNLVQQEERKNMQKHLLGIGALRSRYPW